MPHHATTLPNVPSLTDSASSLRSQTALITPIGKICFEADEQYLYHLNLFCDDSTDIRHPTSSLAQEICRQIAAYFNQPSHHFQLPVYLEGSDHQLKVWRAISEIGAGNLCTYGELAARCQSSSRAVGTACGHNPVPLIIPCHRVVAATGLGGFAGGKTEDTLRIKRWLLTHELFANEMIAK